MEMDGRTLKQIGRTLQKLGRTLKNPDGHARTDGQTREILHTGVKGCFLAMTHSAFLFPFQSRVT